MTHSVTFLSGVRFSAWRTSGARYIASRRLRRREWFSTFSIALFSAISISLAVVQRVYEIKSGTSLDNYITALSIGLGLFVIVISLIESGAANSMRAELLHRNAEELNEFQRKLEEAIAAHADGRPLDEEQITLYRQEYEEIKRRCPYNHEPLDALQFDADQRFSKEFLDSKGKPRMCWCKARWIDVCSWLHPVRYFVVLWIVVGLFIWATPWVAH